MFKSVLNYLSENAKTLPDKISVSYRDSKVTFKELETKAKQYGKTIIDIQGEKSAPKPIGVFCNRGIEPIVGFFGVLYSGNFYVPLDPNMPEAKLNAIITDADIKIVIGLDEHKEIAEKLNANPVFISPVDVSDEMCDLPECQGENYPLYMVYTSGSTGKPKGVLKTHSAEISYIEAYCETFDFSKDDIIGNQTPFYFDAAAKDIFLMLKMGITMEIIPTEYFPLPTELISYLNEKKITFASWVPTVLSIVAQLNPFSLVKPTTLKKVFFVGEVMPMKHLNTWRKCLPEIEYVNLYGQSELCGVCCYYRVEKEFENDAVLPMGLPLKNCKIYLLDNGQVVKEPNRIGEMYIVSDALALEYYNDTEKTNNAFIYKDFGEGSVRCFKTGDLAQYDEEGNLIFASRVDFQIKHTGHRIELGEIETVAGALNDIVRCCCLYNSEKKKIVLFCKLDEASQVTATEIRSILKTKLSSYMVPGKVVILEELPLNANGKIDRQKLKELL